MPKSLSGAHAFRLKGVRIGGAASDWIGWNGMGWDGMVWGFRLGERETFANLA